jgi:hypothetical protein
MECTHTDDVQHNSQVRIDQGQILQVVNKYKNFGERRKYGCLSLYREETHDVPLMNKKKIKKQTFDITLIILYTTIKSRYSVT